MYSNKFIEMGKFHDPGLAPVRDATGAYHVTSTYSAAYSYRYTKTFGFYNLLAAVEDSGRYFHIKPNGEPAYLSSYDWVGNFQENIAVAKQNNKFFHISRDGNKIYDKEYNYVGDFKDGSAVVYEKNQATHIDTNGQYIHCKWFKQLYNYHKGYACAEDQSGWFHVDENGEAIYGKRYKMVEPFYNLLARVEDFDGRILQIDEQNNIVSIIQSVENSSIEVNTNELFADLVGFWKVHIIGISSKLNLFNLLPATTDLISATINLPAPNLLKLLRALWEIKLLDYDVNKDIWSLSQKGEVLLHPKYRFLKSAATMWRDVALQEKWQELPKILHQNMITSHISFKEIKNENSTEYQNALDGYLKLDLDQLIKTLLPKNFNNILVVGQSSKVLTQEWTKYASDLNIKHTTENILKSPTRLVIEQYQTIIFLKTLLHYDDNICTRLLEKAKSSSEIIIIEPILRSLSPCGALLDINMLVESGGRLRYIEDYIKIFNKIHYDIYDVVSINPYLYIIYAREK